MQEKSIDEGGVIWLEYWFEIPLVMLDFVEVKKLKEESWH